MTKRHRKLLKICGIIAAAVIAIGAQMSGAIDLSKWQTLTASLIALFAAFLAYRAAMAKVKFDATSAEKVTRKQKFKVMIQLDLALEELIREANSRPLKTRPYMENPPELRAFVLDRPPEIEIAWNNIENFSADEAAAIARMRYWFADLEALHSGKVPLRL